MSTTFEWSPFLPQIYYTLLAAAAAGIVLFAGFRRMRDFWWRAALLGVLAFLLLNPMILNEVRQSLPDKLVVVVDDSASEHIGGRDKVADAALQNLLGKLKRLSNIDPIVIHAGSDPAAARGESTNLFEALRNSLMSIPLAQVAGTVFITDGQVHDVPSGLGALERLAPFHVLLTGKKDEFDRKITIVSAPKYGVLNERVTVEVKVEETGGKNTGPLPMDIYSDGRKRMDTTIIPGETRSFAFKVEHPGQNVFEFVVPVADGELTDGNNRAPVIVNGIRDRLRVLLVSGSPHMGERSWRNLLKSDPAIDLIHFTILRQTDSFDPTPQSQLALIMFPEEELFEEKINDFDLIILDRWQNYAGMRMPMYFQNIVNYVQHGGAFLMALGTGDMAQLESIGSLSQVLPVTVLNSAGGILKAPYVPQLTALGKSHPVTADLQKQYEQRKWGSWFTQADTLRTHGDMLMTGAGDKPLLVLDKIGDGRVAVLTTDNIWLWSKGLGQAGPYTDLLRNVSHWLMKEPELEDDFIKAEAQGSTITVSERDLTPEVKTVQMTTPSGDKQAITLSKKIPGWITEDVAATASGIYSFDNGHKKAFAVVGTARNEEFADVRTTPDKLKPVVDKTNGGMVWFQENQDFAVKEVGATAGKMGDDDWIGVKRNKAYTVDNVESLSLVPNWLCLLVILSFSIWAWWRESGLK